MKNRCISILALVTLAFMFLTLFCGCRQKSGEEARTYKEPTRLFDGTVYFCNRFQSVGKAPFSLPKDNADAVGETYKYRRFSSKDFDGYIKLLEKEGFDCVRLKWETFCRRDDCLVTMQYFEEEKTLYLYWYARSSFAPATGISENDAEKLLSAKDTLSKVSLKPVDVTPEGFYERTGGQMFIAPVYSYDEYKEWDQQDLMFDDNESYELKLYFVRDGKAYRSDWQCVASADVDGDGEEEVCTLSFGPTSGLFTFIFTVADKSGNVYNTEYYNLSFAEKDGKLVVHGESQSGEEHDFDIVKESFFGSEFITLRDKGEPIGKFIAYDRCVTFCIESDYGSPYIRLYEGGVWHTGESLTRDYFISGNYTKNGDTYVCTTDGDGEASTVTVETIGGGQIRILSVDDPADRIGWLHEGDILTVTATNIQ
ncbi:MAG: hypothetical protein II135_11855 [Clostridia bacterium]|nr:hypothetical protein [Clostridia bacterium]